MHMGDKMAYCACNSEFFAKECHCQVNAENKDKRNNIYGTSYKLG